MMLRSSDHKYATYSLFALGGICFLASLWWLSQTLLQVLDSQEIFYWRITLTGFLLLAHAVFSKQVHLPHKRICVQWFGSVIFGLGTAIALILSWQYEQWLFHLFPLAAALLWLLVSKRVTSFLIALSLLLSSAVSFLWGFDAQWLHVLRFGAGLGIGFAVYFGLGYGLSERFKPITLAGTALLLPSLIFSASVPNSDKSLYIWFLLGLLALCSSYLFYAFYIVLCRQLGLSRSWITSTAEPLAFIALSLLLIPTMTWLIAVILSALVAMVLLSEHRPLKRVVLPEMHSTATTRSSQQWSHH